MTRLMAMFKRMTFSQGLTFYSLPPCHNAASLHMIVIMYDPLFEALLERSVSSLAPTEGQPIFHMEDRVEALFLVISGKVELARIQRDGSKVVLHRAGPGSVIAEASLYSQRYHCDCYCTEAAEIRSIPWNTARLLLRSNSRLSEMWFAQLAAELQATRYRCELLTRNRVQDRLTGWLDWHGPLPPKGQWKELAAELGVSPEALYREIQRRRRVLHPAQGMNLVDE
jgi:CRP-like cAMP-binding protein